MSETHNILEQILDVDGHIRIRPYQVELHSQLQHTILWQTQKNSGLCISHYGDESWLATGEKQAITFHDAQGELGHELRALTLGMLHHGAGEGMLPIKWNTTKRIIRCSKRFGIWLQKCAF